MPADSEQIDEGGLSRRQVLARGAVAAGVVWAAPVIRTATAYATSSAGTERPCINFYLVAVDPLGIRPVRFSPTSRFAYDDIPAEVAAAVAAATTTTTSSTSTTSTTSTSTTTTTKPPAPKAGEPRASRHTTTTTSTTTTTTKPPLRDPDGDETASKVAPTPSTTKPKRANAPRSTTTTTTTTRPPAPSSVSPGAAVDDFGVFGDPNAIDLTSPAAAVPTDPADPHAVALAAAAASTQSGTPDPLPPGIKRWLEDNPDVPVRYPAEEPMVTQTGDEAWAILLRRVDGPDPLTHQCRVVNGCATSHDKHAEFFVDPNPPTTDEDGRRIIFPNPRADDLVSDPSALIERVIFVFCCPQ